MKKVTQEEWIKICKEVHNNKYDYSLVKYTNARDKVDVICHEKDEWGNEHGVFSIRACNHSSGTGCPKCGKRYHMPLDDFILKAKKTHGDKYDYSKVEYNKSTDKVCIICPEHGEFWQTAALHIYGSGCPECAREQSVNKRKSTTEKFIEKAKLIHGDKYDYSKVKYINISTKVCIICPEHGEFWQVAGNHLNGEGCPECKMISTIIQKWNIVVIKTKLKLFVSDMVCLNKPQITIYMGQDVLNVGQCYLKTREK